MPYQPGSDEDTQLLALSGADQRHIRVSNQVNVVHSNTNSDQGDLKLDWVASAKDHVYTRYSQQHITNPTTNSQLLTGDSDNEFPLYNGVIDYSHTFSPFLLKLCAHRRELLSRDRKVSSNATNQNLPTLFGIAGSAPDQTFLPSMTFNGPSYSARQIRQQQPGLFVPRHSPSISKIP